MNAQYPRVLFAAPRSGEGKTTVTCAVLAALVARGLDVAAFKCGPDFIDPMFHREVIGAKSANLDLFFTPPDVLRALFAQRARGCGVSVVEGVMGFYDGLSMTSSEASSYAVAKALGCPVVLVVSARGAAVSVLAAIKGFLDYEPDANIRAVILNRCSGAQFEQLAPLIRERLGVEPLGFLPRRDDCSLESRHLGLVTAAEVRDLRQKLATLAGDAERCINLDGLLRLAGGAPALGAGALEVRAVTETAPRIAVARDKAFCFYYEENLALLKSLGAELVPFSPLHDAALPPGVSGLYLGGGYPELYLDALSGNGTMRADIAANVCGGLPTLAECGGFLYLQDSITDADGCARPMCGAIRSNAHMTQKLGRFGYVTLTARRDNLLCTAGQQIRAHEFHYSDSEDVGGAFEAQKPLREVSWPCIHATDTLFAGYPHLYFHANPEFAARFVGACAEYQADKGSNRT